MANIEIYNNTTEEQSILQIQRKISIKKTLAAYNVCNKWAVVQGKVSKTRLGQEKMLKVTQAATVE